MPTTITGNPTGVSSPSPQPGPDTVVDMQAPQDGVDGVNAVTVNQPLAAAANELAWLKKPTAATPASPGALDPAFVQPIRAARNVRTLRRDFEDHRGFGNMARIKRWQEDWGDVGFLTAQNSGGPRKAWNGRWTISITPGSGTPVIVSAESPYPAGPSAPSYGGPMLVIDSGNVTSTACLLAVEENIGTWITDDSDIAMQFEPGIGAPVSNLEQVVGLFVQGSSATGGFASTNPVGFGIYSGASHATHCALYTCDGLSAPVFHDLGAAGDASTRFRLEYQGVNASDDSNARVLVYGDGDTTKPLANVAFSILPVTGHNQFVQTLFRLLSGGGRQIGTWGVVDFASARVPGDVAY